MNTLKRRAAVNAPFSASRSISLNGALLFIAGMSLIGAGFSSSRLSFAGLRVHAYLMVIGAFFPVLAITRLHLIPPRHLFNLSAFAAFYFATTIPGGISASEGIKVGAAVATIITMAMLVRQWSDFVAGVMGMCIAVALLAVLGIQSEVTSGVDLIAEGNRNTYSLYALPAILLGGFVLIHGHTDSLLSKLIIVGSVFASSLAICLNLNRSGWLGLAVAALLILREKSSKAALFLLPLALGLYLLITMLFPTEQIKTRFIGTRNSNASDRLRWQLIESSIRIGLENPLMGVSPQDLPYQLANAAEFGHLEVYSHNVYAHIIGGCGFICLFLMFNIGYHLWRWRPASAIPASDYMRFRAVRRIMQSVLILWMVRGCFTHEIIYSPAFNMAIGLALGLQISFSARRTPLYEG